MGMEEFRRYLNELDLLSLEVQRCPELQIGASAVTQDGLLQRFELNRALVNLLHYATVHMMRADAHDYDAESERWILGVIDRTFAQIQEDLSRPMEAGVRTLVLRALHLVNRIMADLQHAAA